MTADVANQHGSWQFNVRDQFKPLSTEEINVELNKTRLPCSVLIQNVNYNINVGNIVRSCNNYNISEVFYFGKRHIDRRSALCSYHYIPVHYLASLDEIKNLKNKYSLVGLENNRPGTILIQDFKYPEKPCFVFGEENSGIAPEVMDLLGATIEIPSRGSIRSLNVATAAGICLHDYFSKLPKE